MTSATIAEQTRAILAEQATMEPEDLRDTDTPEALGIDSMALVEAIFAIEEAFDIDVPFNANTPQDSPLDISSVAAICAAVERLVAEQKGPKGAA